jgi:hypothetical protein
MNTAFITSFRTLQKKKVSLPLGLPQRYRFSVSEKVATSSPVPRKKFQASLLQRKASLLKYTGTHMLNKYMALVCRKERERRPFAVKR